MDKLNKKQLANFDFKIKQLKDELKTDRHILACLGSVGLTFTDDIKKEWKRLTKKQLENEK